MVRIVVSTGEGMIKARFVHSSYHGKTCCQSEGQVQRINVRLKAKLLEEEDLAPSGVLGPSDGEALFPLLLFR